MALATRTRATSVTHALTLDVFKATMDIGGATRDRSDVWLIRLTKRPTATTTTESARQDQRVAIRKIRVWSNLMSTIMESVCIRVVNAMNTTSMSSSA